MQIRTITSDEARAEQELYAKKSPSIHESTVEKIAGLKQGESIQTEMTQNKISGLWKRTKQSLDPELLKFISFSSKKTNKILNDGTPLFILRIDRQNTPVVRRGRKPENN